MTTLEKCVQCGECEKRCPYNLDILDIFAETKAYYKELCEQFGPKSAAMRVLPLPAAGNL